MVAVLAAMPATLFAQSEVLAHWDFKDGYTGHTSLYPEDNGIDCVTPKKVVVEGLGYSWTTKDSEDYSSYGANCFGGWSDSDCVIFCVDFANEAVGSIKEINFDVGNYGGKSLYLDWIFGTMEPFIQNGGVQGYVARHLPSEMANNNQEDE